MEISKMNKELEQKLIAKYPIILQDCKLSERESCMGRGFEHGDGWYNILEILLEVLMYPVNKLESDIATCDKYVKEQDNEWMITEKPFWTSEKLQIFRADLELAKQELPIFEQVKEKFGDLTIYFRNGDARSRALINFAEAMSERTCEFCGNVGHHRNDGWIKTLCHACEQKKS